VSVPEREHRGLLGVRRQGLRSPRRGSWYFSAELPSAAGEKWPVQATKCRPSLQQWSSAVGSITPETKSYTYTQIGSDSVYS
jgi:hypothetical protein